MVGTNNDIGKFPFLWFTLHAGTGGQIPFLGICICLITNVVSPEESALNLFEPSLKKQRCCRVVVFKPDSLTKMVIFPTVEQGSHLVSRTMLTHTPNTSITYPARMVYTISHPKHFPSDTEGHKNLEGTVMTTIHSTAQSEPFHLC